MNSDLHQQCIEISTQVDNLELLGGLPVGKSEKKNKNNHQIRQMYQMHQNHRDIEKMKKCNPHVSQVSHVPQVMYRFAKVNGNRIKNQLPSALACPEAKPKG